MRTLLPAIIFLLCFQLKADAQRLPVTNIMLFDLDQRTDSIFLFKNPSFLTEFNKMGYNNQPYWMSDEELYLTAQFPADTTQTDIYALNVKKGTLTQVTATVESEYSPNFIPPRNVATDAPSFSAVRVEVEGQQRLWRFPLDRSNNGRPVFNTLENIGYHYWVDYRDVLLFIVGAPHYLVIADTRDESKRNITANIGRCFQELPDGDIAFIHKTGVTNWLLKKLDTQTYRTQLITATLPESEDFAVLNDGTILMANGAKLYKFNKAIDIDWLEIGDFGYYGIKKITRIAVNGAQDKIALVVE